MIGQTREQRRLRSQFLARRRWCECGQPARELIYFWQVPGTDDGLRAVCKRCHATAMGAAGSDDLS